MERAIYGQKINAAKEEGAMSFYITVNGQPLGGNYFVPATGINKEIFSWVQAGAFGKQTDKSFEAIRFGVMANFPDENVM